LKRRRGAGVEREPMTDEAVPKTWQELKLSLNKQ
jgi:hypothetical protein